MDIPKRLSGLSLFSGIGGIDLALREWVQSVAYCEIDPFCQSVLLQRMQEGYLPQAPIWSDVKTLPFNELPKIDIIYGGFPCQDISCAGLGKGLAGERSGLFYEIMRLAAEIKPSFLFLENVPAITTRGGLDVVKTIAEMGYDCRWCVISAASVGSLHRRERWFLLANAKREGLEGFGDRTGSTSEKILLFTCTSDDGNANSESSQQTDTSTQPIQDGRDTRRRLARQYWPFESPEHWQETVACLGKCTDGISHLVERLKSIGNAVVPQQVYKAFQILAGLK